MRLITAVVVTLALSSPIMRAGETFGSVSVKDYQKAMSSTNRDVAVVMRTFVDGLGTGISFTNVWNMRNGNSPVFCQPEKLALETDNYIRILDDAIKIWVGGSKDKAQAEELPITVLLLQGLIDTFPCPAKK